jgi:multicomponent Na+:H+ antiporter subunit C
MQVILAVLVGGLYAAGLYMMLRRSIFKLLLGLALLSHAANLLIFTAGGLNRGIPPLVETGATELSEHAADPIPQALILTAIVISFGVLAFAIVLASSVHQTFRTDDVDDMTATDR